MDKTALQVKRVFDLGVNCHCNPNFQHVTMLLIINVYKELTIAIVFTDQ